MFRDLDEKFDDFDSLIFLPSKRFILKVKKDIT